MVRITAVQMSVDREDGVDHIVRSIASAPPSDLLCFPGLSIGGEASLPATEVDQHLSYIGTAAQQRRAWCIVGSATTRNGKHYNEVHVLDRSGQLTCTYQKMNLSPLEEGIFTPGKEQGIVHTDIGRIGLLECWDMSNLESVRALARSGADLLVCIAKWVHAKDPSYTLKNTEAST